MSIYSLAICSSGIYSLGGPVILQFSNLATLVNMARVPSPRHAVAPVMALWAKRQKDNMRRDKQTDKEK